MGTTNSWRLHSKLPDQQDHFSGLQRNIRGVPRVMLAPGEEGLEDERGSDIADRGMMMGLKKRARGAVVAKGCGPCGVGGQEERLHELQEMVYRMLVESGDI